MNKMNWSSDQNIKLIYRLLKVRGYGPAQTNRLLWSIRSKVSDAIELERMIAASLPANNRSAFYEDFDLYRSMKYDVSYMSIMDDTYPTELLNSLLQNAPSILSYIGNVELLKKKKIGYSGSRKVSEKGLWITRDSVEQLSDDDVCIVSGYASGVDLAAHRKALEHGASTILVLPEGIKYFTIKKELEDVWDWTRVLVLSEFFPEDKWMAGRAMKRNQTLIGLSDIMMVIEAGETGGSLDAGLKTIEMQKSLFVPLYKEIPDSAKGNEVLLRKGAKPLTFNGMTHRTNVSMVQDRMVNRTVNCLFDLV